MKYEIGFRTIKKYCSLSPGNIDWRGFERLYRNAKFCQRLSFYEVKPDDCTAKNCLILKGKRKIKEATK